MIASLRAAVMSLRKWTRTHPLAPHSRPKCGRQVLSDCDSRPNIPFHSHQCSQQNLKHDQQHPLYHATAPKTSLEYTIARKGRSLWLPGRSF